MLTNNTPTTAVEFLTKAGNLLVERAKQYDQPGGERSMGRTVEAFNIITGRALTEAEGWLLMQLLKDVRQWQTPGKLHQDSAEDCVSYAALKAEALARAGAPQVAAPAECTSFGIVRCNWRKYAHAHPDHGNDETCLTCGAFRSAAP